jgi:hypothetical protein
MMRRIFPSVISTCWREDFRRLGIPKQVLFHHNEVYINHIGLYNLTLQDIAKAAALSDVGLLKGFRKLDYGCGSLKLKKHCKKFSF